MAVKRRTASHRTVYDTISVFAKILFIFGYTGFYKKDSRLVSTKGMLAYSILMPIYVVSSLIHGIYIFSTDHSHFISEIDIILLLIVALEFVMIILTFSFNVVTMQSNRHQHIHIFEHLENLDEQLVQEFDVEMCYEKMAYKISFISVTFFVYSVIVMLAVISHWQHGDIFVIFGIITIYSFLHFGTHLVVFSFMTVADLIRVRFRLIQKLLDPVFLRKHFKDREEQISKLRKAIKIYQGLYEVIDETNGVYGNCLQSCLAHDFTMVTSLFYLLFGRSSNLWSTANLRSFFGILLVLLPPAYKMVMMPVYTTMSMKEGKKCMRAIKLMDDAFPKDGQVRQIVGATLMWNNHNKVEYKIGHVITANVGMMAAVISGIVNYVIILIQFQIQEEIVNQEKENVTE